MLRPAGSHLRDWQAPVRCYSPRPVNPLGRDGDASGHGGAPGSTNAATRLAELEALAVRIAADFAGLLAPVLGNVTLLEEELPDGHPAHRRVKGIRDAVVASRAYAQRLALIDAKRKPSLHRVEIGALLRGCLPALRQQLGPQIAIELANDGAADQVRVEAKHIERAMLELARNAEDAVTGPGTLHIEAGVVEGGVGQVPPGRWVRLLVRDNGRGMEPSLLARAFEPFVTTKVPGGTAGLGLAIVASIVRQHDGFLEADSRPGAGTTISIYLPNHGLDPASRPNPVPGRGKAASAAAQVPGAAVLLVEDNAMVRRSIEVTLRAAGYRVTSVDSGERCIAAVARAEMPLDLLISDVVMPEMSGEEMIGRVHELRPGLPVLFISGYDRSTLARRKHSVKTEHFLQKPFDSEDLFAAVNAVLAARPGPNDG